MSDKELTMFFGGLKCKYFLFNVKKVYCTTKLMFMKYLKYLQFVIIYYCLFGCSSDNSENQVQTIKAPTIEWQKTLEGNVPHSAEWILQTSDGGYILAANSNSNGLGNTSCWVIKLNSIGEVSWKKSYGSSYAEDMTCFEQTSDGGYIFGGYKPSEIGNTSWIVKVTSDGTVEWDKQIEFGEIVNCIRESPDHGYILATESDKGDLKDTDIVKLNSSGVVQWQKYYAASRNNIIYSLKVTNDGGFVFAGIADLDEFNLGTLNIRGDYDYWVLKADAQGEIQWQKSFGGSAADYARSISQSNDGGYIVAGLTRSNDFSVFPNPGGNSIWVLKLDSNGGVQWEKCYGNEGSEYASSIEQTIDGGFILAGKATSINEDEDGTFYSDDALIIKLNNNGDIQWQKTIGGKSNEEVNCIQQTLDHGFIFTGYDSSNSNGNNFWVVKLSEAIIEN